MFFTSEQAGNSLIFPEEFVGGPKNVIPYLQLWFADGACLEKLHSWFVAVAANDITRFLQYK